MAIVDRFKEYVPTRTQTGLPQGFNALRFLQDFERQKRGQRDLTSFIFLMNALTNGNGNGNGSSTVGGIGKSHLKDTLSRLETEELMAIATSRALSQKSILWLAEIGPLIPNLSFQFAVTVRSFASLSNGQPADPVVIERCRQGFIDEAQNGHSKALLLLAEEVMALTPARVPRPLLETIATAMIATKRKTQREDVATAVRAVEIVRCIDGTLRGYPYTEMLGNLTRDVQETLLRLPAPAREAVLENIKESGNEVLYYETIGLFRLDTFIRRFNALTPGKRNLTPLVLFINEIAEARKRGIKVQMLTAVINSLSAAEKEALAFNQSLNTYGLYLLRSRLDKIDGRENMQLIVVARLWAIGTGTLGAEEWALASMSLTAEFEDGRRENDPRLLSLAKTLLLEAKTMPAGLRKKIEDYAETIRTQAEQHQPPQVAHALAILIAVRGETTPALDLEFNAYLEACSPETQKHLSRFLRSMALQRGHQAKASMTDEDIAHRIIDGMMGPTVPPDQTALLEHPDAVLRHYGFSTFMRLFRLLSPEQRKAVLTHPDLAVVFLHEAALELKENGYRYDEDMAALYEEMFMASPDRVLAIGGVKDFREYFALLSFEEKRMVAMRLVESPPEGEVDFLLWIGSQLSTEAFCQEKLDYFAALEKAISRPAVAEQAEAQRSILLAAERRLAAISSLSLPKEVEKAEAILATPLSAETLALSGKRQAVERETEKLQTRVDQIRHTEAVQKRINAIDALLKAEPFDETAAKALLDNGFVVPQHALNKKELERKEKELRDKLAAPKIAEAERLVCAKIAIIDELLADFDLEMAEHFFAEAVPNRELAPSNEKLTKKEHQLWVKIRIAKINAVYEDFTIEKAKAVLEDKVEIPKDTPGYEELKTAARRLKTRLADAEKVTEARKQVETLLAAFDLARAQAVLAVPLEVSNDAPGPAEYRAKRTELETLVTNTKKVNARLKAVKAALELATFELERAKAVRDAVLEAPEGTPGLTALREREAALRTLVDNVEKVEAKRKQIQQLLPVKPFDLATGRALNVPLDVPKETPGLSPLRTLEKQLADKVTKEEQIALDNADIQARIKEITRLLGTEPFDLAGARKLLDTKFTPRNKDTKLGELRKTEDQLRTKIREEEDRLTREAEEAAEVIEAEEHLEPPPPPALTPRAVEEPPLTPLPEPVRPPIPTRAAAVSAPAARKPKHLNVALDRLAQDPTDALAWEALLELGAEVVRPAKAAAGKKKASHVMDKEVFLERLTLAIPALTADQATSIQRSWGKSGTALAGDAYDSAAENEENMDTAFSLFRSAELLGNTSSCLSAWQLTAIKDDIVYLRNLLQTRNWYTFERELEARRAELDLKTFLLLAGKLGPVLTRILITADLGSLPQPVPIELFEEVLCSFTERRADVEMLKQLDQKRTQVTAKASRTLPEATSGMDLSIAVIMQKAAMARRRLKGLSPMEALMDLADTPDSRFKELFDLLHAKAMAAFIRHPHAQAAGTVLPLTDRAELRKAFVTLGTRKKPEPLVFSTILAEEIHPLLGKDLVFLSVLGENYLRLHEHHKAIGVYRTLTAEKPDALSAIYYLAFCYKNLDQWQNIIALAPRVQKAHHINQKDDKMLRTELYRFIGSAFSIEGQWDKAKEWLERSLEVDPANYHTMQSLCNQYILECRRLKKAGDPARAEAAIDKAMELARQLEVTRPTDEETHALVGEVYLEKGQYEKAAQHLELSIGISRGKAAAGMDIYQELFVAATAYEDLGQPRGMARHLDTALNMKYSKETFRMTIAALLQANQFSRAILYLKAAIALFPESRFQYEVDIAYALREDGQYSEAHAIYDRLLAEAPESDLALYHKGICFYKETKLAEARACFVRIPDTSPHYAGTQESLVMLHVLEKEYQAAVDLGTMLWERTPETEKRGRESLAFNVSRACWELGQIEEAERWAQRLLAINPAYHRELLETRLKLEDDPEGVFAVRAEILTADPYDRTNWKFFFSSVNKRPELAPRAQALAVSLREKADFNIIYRVAVEMEAEKLFFDLCLPVADPVAAEIRGYFAGEPIPEAQELILNNLNHDARIKTALKILGVRRLEAEGRVTEAMSACQALIKTNWSTIDKTLDLSDLELEARFTLFNLMLSQSRDPLDVDKALRALRPAMEKAPAKVYMFRTLATLMGNSSPSQAGQIGQLILENIRGSKGSLVTAMAVFLLLSQESGIHDSIPALAKSLREEFKKK